MNLSKSDDSKYADIYKQYIENLKPRSASFDILINIENLKMMQDAFPTPANYQKTYEISGIDIHGNDFLPKFAQRWEPLPHPFIQWESSDDEWTKKLNLGSWVDTKERVGYTLERIDWSKPISMQFEVEETDTEKIGFKYAFKSFCPDFQVRYNPNIYILPNSGEPKSSESTERNPLSRTFAFFRNLFIKK